jgi:hypothetical protein
MNLIAKGEGSYNDYNRGDKEKSEGSYFMPPAMSVVDLSNTTISKIRGRNTSALKTRIDWGSGSSPDDQAYA